MALCSVDVRYQHFGEPCCLPLQASQPRRPQPECIAADQKSYQNLIYIYTFLFTKTLQKVPILCLGFS